LSERPDPGCQSSVKKPSRLCKFLLALVGFKIGLLGAIMFDPLMDTGITPPSAVETAASWRNNSNPARMAGGALPDAPQSTPAAVAESGPAVPETTPVTAEFSAAPENTRAVRKAPGIAFAATPVNMPQNDPAPASVSLEALSRKQEELARKEEDLKSLQAELDVRFQQMQDLEQRLKIMLKDAEEIKDSRYRQLVDVLSNMKARQAAEVLSTLDEKIAVRVLAGMRGRQAGEILSLADPIKAARLAEALARMQMPLQ
jgi:flagellar motility protein MotE (MotC chaperone)